MASKKNKIKFIDLFSGIGGFHSALHDLGAECVFASEIDKYARQTYEENFKKKSPSLFKNGMFNDDILKINPKDVPDHDILCAGFPCQPFSQAGFKKGFKDRRGERGNMFFIIKHIIEAKKPAAIFLENVRHLKNHDDGKTFKVIRSVIEEELGYSFNYKVVKASDCGLPQHRPRLFMIGFRNEKTQDSTFKFPEKIPLKFSLSDALGGKCEKEIGYTLRVGGRGSGLNDRRNWDTYLVDNKEMRIGVKEGRKLMGYPNNFIFPVSNTQAMKQLGNSVAVNAIKLTAENIIKYIK